MKAYAYFQKHNGSVTRVAEVDVPKGMDTDHALEHVYCLLQNIRGSWSFGPNFEGSDTWRLEGEPNLDYSDAVKFVGKYPEHCDGSKMGERSMMIGDLIHLVSEDVNKTYEVAPFGFEEYKEAV